MKKHILVLFLILFFMGLSFAQREIVKPEAYASYYAEAFHGRLTASGEVFNMYDYTAAHRTLPFGTILEVTNLENRKSVIVRINDRGPFVGNRDIDLSKAAAEALDMLSRGTTKVSLVKVDLRNQPALGLPKNTKTLDSSGEYVQRQAAQQEYNKKPSKQKSFQNLVYNPTTSVETAGPLWRIQLGSFKREENSIRLVIKLREINFEPAYEKTKTHIRVVLYGIRPSELEKVKQVLKENGYNDYILRQESW